MAKKTVFVSDFSNKEIGDEKQSATITVRYGDGRRGVIIADAHVDDDIVGRSRRSVGSRRVAVDGRRANRSDSTERSSGLPGHERFGDAET